MGQGCAPSRIQPAGSGPAPPSYIERVGAASSGRLRPRGLIAQQLGACRRTTRNPSAERKKGHLDKGLAQHAARRTAQDCPIAKVQVPAIRSTIMQVSFMRAEFTDVKEDVSRHLDSLRGPIDSFLEDHVRDSNHYVISVLGRRAGFASIHSGGLITQFSLTPEHQRFGQSAFQALRRIENVGAAFVPTCDEFYLSHAIDDYRQLLKQAYFFEVQPSGSAAVEAGAYSLRVATGENEGAIREQSGHLFGDVGKRIESGELFVTDRAGVSVGFGILAKSPFQRSVASIGMFTLEQFRGAGVGTATIALLVGECSRRSMRAVAGCWYYNHASKRTLERAGMTTKTRLLKVEY
jgi:GNAT superfamily N-acetyltransferase